MTNEWRKTSLGEIVAESGGTIQTGPFGSQLHGSDYSKNGTPVIMPTNIRDLRISSVGIARVSEDHVKRLVKYRVRTGDIIYSRRGDVEKCALVTSREEGWLCGTGCLLVRIDQKTISSRFLSYYLALPAVRTWIRQHAVGATMPNLNTAILGEVPITLPPLQFQHAVADLLGALDDKIESNQNIAATAFSLAREHANQATQGKSLAPYGTAIQVTMGAAFKGDRFSSLGEGRPLIRIRDLKTFAPQTWTTETRSDEKVIHPGNILVGMDAEFRATLWLGEKSVLNQRVCAFNGNDGVGRAFVLAALEPELARQERAKTGTTVIHLNKSDISKFQVPQLSIDEHQALSELTEPLIELIVARAMESRALKNLRDALLPELLSGRIQIGL